MTHRLPQATLSSHPFILFDARVKFLAALAVLVMVLGSRGIAFPLLTAALCVALCLFIGVRLRLLLIRFAEPLLIAIMLLLLKLFLSGTVPLFSLELFGLTIVGHSDGLREGVLIASRIAGAVTVVAAAGFATPFTELLAALAWLRVPPGIIEVALFAWRYLFVLADDAQVVYAAQKNRLGYVGLARSFRSFGTLSGALVIKAFDSSQTMTTAMVQRGYDGRMPLLKQKPFRWGEVMAAFAIVAFMGVLWRI